MKEFERLVELIKILRAPDGCPWDKVQTLETLKPCLREETAEVLEAMEGDPEEHKGELGDLIMNIVFQASIREDEGNFDIEDVCRSINEKLIRRHPHVFAKKDNSLTPDEVSVNWDEIKKTEKIHENRKSALDGIPKYLSSLDKAKKIQSKAKKVGFDWNRKDIGKVMDKIYEELEELKIEIKNKNREKMEDELGDVLFSIVNLSRFIDIDPTSALEKSIKKFDSRFRYVEENCDLSNSTLDEMEILWQKAKSKEKK